MTDNNKIQANSVDNNKIQASLTEQWKKGELPNGYYYCKTGNGVEILRTWGDKYNQLLNNLDEVFMKEMSDCKIISEVPSCEEWKKAYECVVSENEEITTLKKLLKECRGEISPYKDFISGISGKKTFKSLIAKINQALGEDK